MSHTLLIATTGLEPDQLADTQHQYYPRVDYLDLGNFLDFDLHNYNLYQQTRLGRLFHHIEIQLRSDLYLTLRSWLARRKYDRVFAMSERAGLPYATLNRLRPGRRAFLSMFQCWSKRQESAVVNLNLFAGMDAVAVHCQSMKETLIRLGAPADKIHILRYGVDQNFFAPQPDIAQESNLILSVGEVRSRNYDLLLQAVDGLPVQLVAAASGTLFAREKQRKIKTPPPDNAMITGRLPQWELRNLYARAQFVVLPVFDLVYSGGLTALLEAGSMARAVIATRSRGLSEFIIDGETGILVEPDDAAGLRAAIEYLAGRPDEARRIGQNARQWVEERQNLDLYVSDIANFLQTAA